MMIKDVLYKFIEVPDICKKFIDTPEFNRLRHIKQLGLVYFIYPSATHTRFEHSLGVMYLAGKVADHLSEYISKKEKELLQLAGLLHDIGHIAFSHLFDYILEENKFPRNIANHEERFLIIIKQINKRLNILSDSDISTIYNMIKGDDTNTDKKYLYQIISNKKFGIDVDRLDYISRDMYHTNLSSFFPEYIISNFRINNNNLSLLSKSYIEAENIFDSRRRLYQTVYRHKTVLKIERIIRYAIAELKMSVNEFEDFWQKIDDNRILCMISDVSPDSLDMIYNRKFDHIKITEEDRYKHINLITKDQICKELENINWV